jgi:integrase
MKIKKNKNGEWGFDFTCNGIRVRKIVGLSKQEAEQVMWNEKKKMKRDGFGLKEAAKNVYFEDFAAEFLELYCKKKKKSWARDEISIEHLKKSFKGKFLSVISPDMIERYMADRKDKVSSSTVNREIACLKTLFNKAVQWKKIETNPAANVEKFKERNQRERILSDEEMRRLLEVAAPHLKPILIIALSTGMRRNEILGLKWNNVHVPERYLFIEDSKSGKSRKIPLNSQMIAALEGLTRDSEFLFFNKRKNRHLTDIAIAFKGACARAGISGLRLHDLRHSAASAMIRNGIDIVTVSKILGHSSIQMTMRYAHPTSENMSRAVEVLGRIIAKKSPESVNIPVNSGKNKSASDSIYVN